MQPLAPRIRELALESAKVERKLQQRETLLTVAFEVYTQLMDWASNTAHPECSQEVLDIMEQFREHFEDNKQNSVVLTTGNQG